MAIVTRKRAGARREVLRVIALSMTMALASRGAAQPPDATRFVNGLIGKTFWLKVDVVRIQRMLGGMDATNIYPDGMVRYQARIGIRRTESTNVEEFTKDAQRSIQQNRQEAQVRVASAGTKVTMSMVKVEDKEIELEFRDTGNSKQKIRLKFDEGHYTLEDVQRLIAVCFADSEAEAKGKATVTITVGMSIVDVIAAKGAPKTRVDLGAKTILTYDDMKLVFQDGKLADVQ
jgi:hypothetical protein